MIIPKDPNFLFLSAPMQEQKYSKTIIIRQMSHIHEYFEEEKKLKLFSPIKYPAYCWMRGEAKLMTKPKKKYALSTHISTSHLTKV